MQVCSIICVLGSLRDVRALAESNVCSISYTSNPLIDEYEFSSYGHTRPIQSTFMHVN